MAENFFCGIHHDKKQLMILSSDNSSIITTGSQVKQDFQVHPIVAESERIFKCLALMKLNVSHLKTNLHVGFFEDRNEMQFQEKRNFYYYDASKCDAISSPT